MSVLGFSLDWTRRLLEGVAESKDYNKVRDVVDKLKKDRHRIANEIANTYKSSSLRERLRLTSSHMDLVARFTRQACLGVVRVKAVVEDASKLLVGSSAGILSHVFEVGLAWDHVYDLPYIPGSSLKGAVRAAVEDLLAGKQGGREIVEALFGSVGSVGCVEFLDSYPVDARDGLVEVDIITPHYYRGGRVVEDELKAQPTPVVHVSVAPGTVFEIIVAYRCPRSLFQRVSELLRLSVKPVEYIIAVLVGLALRNGIGARTTKGYGVFRLLDVRVEEGDGGEC